jgi:hypothetical protein
MNKSISVIDAKIDDSQRPIDIGIPEPALIGSVLLLIFAAILCGVCTQWTK